MKAAHPNHSGSHKMKAQILKLNRTILISLAATLFGGCVGIIPLPPVSSQTIGTPLRRPEIQFIQPGITTRADVTNRLGAASREVPAVHAMAYSWEKPTVRFMALTISPETGAWDQEFEWNRWRALFVHYDQSGKITRLQLVWLDGDKSLDSQLEKWATTPVAQKEAIAVKSNHHLGHGRSLALE